MSECAAAAVSNLAAVRRLHDLIGTLLPLFFPGMFPLLLKSRLFPTLFPQLFFPGMFPLGGVFHILPCRDIFLSFKTKLINKDFEI